MVLVNSPSSLYDIIECLDWFSNIGKPITTTQSFIQANNLQEAFDFWISPTFLQARSVAWEAFRKEIVKDKKLLVQWEKAFTVCNEKLIHSISRSRSAQALLRFLRQGVNEFCRSLPFTAAVGESFILDKHPNYIYNLSQIAFYQEGHWVCGWNGTLYEDMFVYPELNFIVY